MEVKFIQDAADGSPGVYIELFEAEFVARMVQDGWKNNAVTMTSRGMVRNYWWVK